MLAAWVAVALLAVSAVWIGATGGVGSDARQGGLAGTDSGSGQLCGVSGGPPWLFEVMVAAGMLAVVYGTVWLVLLLSQGRPAQHPKRSRWVIVPLVPSALLLATQFVQDPGSATIRLVVLLVFASPAVVTIVVMNRRALATGTVPSARSAPFGMFWIMVALSVLALACSLTALVATFALGHITPC
jgi:hypothetical protein